MDTVRVLEDGSLFVGRGRTIPADEVELRVSTSGGPGGQHANRSLTKVTATFHVRGSSLSPADQEYLGANGVEVVRTSASRFRSQRQNRDAALDQLAARLGAALERPVDRRVTKPTRASRERRLEEKHLVARKKRERRVREED